MFAPSKYPTLHGVLEMKQFNVVIIAILTWASTQAAFSQEDVAAKLKKEVTAKLKMAIEQDSSIPDREWQSLDARNQPIDHKKLKGTTLTSTFISMRAPDELNKAKSDELDVFKTSTVVRIIDEIERVKAPYTFIHADRITDLEFKIDNDTAQGTFSFLVTDLYKGKIGYRAKLTESDWRITEFLLPAHGIHLVRDGETWTTLKPSIKSNP